MQKTLVQFLGWVVNAGAGIGSTPVFLGFPCGSADKDYACNVGDLGSIAGLGTSPGEEKDHPLQYSGLENAMDFIVHEVTKSLTWLSDFHFHLVVWSEMDVFFF